MENNLLDRIEELRKSLHDFAFTENLVAPEVVELSQRLDHLLNQYHKFIRQP